MSRIKSAVQTRAAIVPVLGVAIVVWTFWLIGMFSEDRWGLFADNWFMSVTMAFGSFIAGATSEGGGAVAFPVMTLLFEIPPPTARDFSLMIQSIGMTAAAATILFTKTNVEKNALIWASVGGTIGVVLGLEFVAGRFSPAFAKMFFISIWLAFAFALFMINRYRDREVLSRIEPFTNKHAMLLIAAGVIGGMITSITGSGLDIATFALLVLRFRINESIATPTSVVLMGINAFVGFVWKAGVGGGMAEAAWGYWWVCVPIVVVGAPIGAWFIKSRSRHFVSRLLYASIAIQFVAAIVIIPMNLQLVLFTTAVFSVGLLFFRRMADGGVKRLQWLEIKEERKAVHAARKSNDDD